MTLEDHVLADIERRLSSLESDNRRFTIKNQQIHKTNIDLKQEIQQGKAENQKLRKGVRRLEIENRHCMQVVKNIQETMRLLVEENQKLTKSNEMADRHDPVASQDINGNFVKSKDVTWTAPTEAHDFSYSVPYSVLKSASSAFQQAERSDSNGKQYTPDELNKNLVTDVIDSFVKDRPSMPVQRSNNGSIATASTQSRTVQSKSPKNARAAGPSAAVAFHARLSSDLTSPGDDQTIIMSDVLTNEGSAYERLSGHFTSPVSVCSRDSCTLSLKTRRNCIYQAFCDKIERV
ncbi:hypothetical protein KP79_PYT01092 [Mizuhopecten yessoensis]|uniref:C1q domain-containing protein n=1 Tax=Mizuhopecten yessoensis TaxID=6573 RepID=A0A210QKC1_MIZYE|nr:hypothetical protein KP79_PYT01092 [Mizuhopecten yessoensis]